MLYSYDVFDTVITRKTATPQGIFALMQKKLATDKKYSGIVDDIINNFFELRIQSERLARYNYCVGGKEDITIKDIYQVMNTTGLLDDKIIDVLIECEYETECENVIGIKSIIEEIVEHIESGHRVVFISDMYLDKNMIRNLLIRADERLENIPLYLSSEIGKMKVSGNLFSVVRQKEMVSFTEWIHVGDNEISDVKVPHNLGIETRRVHANILTKMEKALLEKNESNISFQIMLGIAKNTRLLNKLSNSGVVGTSLGGILLVSYVRWILCDAMRRGIKSLYFVARDGYVLKLIADYLIDSLKLKINTKYVYGSRKAWRMPAKATGKIDILQLLQASTPEFVTDISKVAGIFEITEEKLLEFLPMNCAVKKKKLSRADVDTIFYYLSSCDEFKVFLEEMNSGRRELVKEYFLQELNMQEEDWAFVEVGGTGYTQKCLESILKDIADKRICTYFFQLYAIMPGEESIFYNFIPDGLYIKDAIEPLCRAPHGQTLYYAEKEGKVEPVLEKVEKERLKQCGYDDYIRGLLAYTDVMTKYYVDVLEQPVDRKLIDLCWHYYTHVSDEEILDFVGEVPFEVIGDNLSCATYAPKLTQKDIEDIFDLHYSEPSSWYYKGASLNMSLLRATKEEQEYIRTLGEKNRESSQSCISTSRRGVVSQLAKIPSEQFVKGAKVIIYGAGNLGHSFYYNVGKKEKFEIVLWVDRQYERMQKEQKPVVHPDEILNVKYDKILIAVLSKRLADQIRQSLIDMGIEEKDIDWISPEELIRGGANE